MALAVSPSRAKASSTRLLTFLDPDAGWQSVAPTFAASGVAGVTLGAVTVVSGTMATATATYGANRGQVTWTDSTTGRTCVQSITGTGRGPTYVGRR